MAIDMKHIEKRGSDKFRVVLRDKSGKKVYSDTVSTLAAARILRTDMLKRRDLDGVIQVASTKDTLAFVIKEYFKQDGNWGTDKTWHLNKLSEGPLGPLTLAQLSKGVITEYVVKLGMAAPNANKRVSYLSKALQFAKFKLLLGVDMRAFEEAREFLVEGEVIGSGVARTRKTTQEEIDRIAAEGGKHSNSIDLAEIMQFLAILPIRVGELLKIKWTDIDHDRKEVKLRQRKHPNPQVKARNDEVVPLVLGTYEMLMARKAKAVVDVDHPFAYTICQVSNAMNVARQAAGLNYEGEGEKIEDRLHIHDLRAHAITKMLNARVNPYKVMAISGHKDPKVFFKHYVRMTNDDVRSEIEQLMEGKQPQATQVADLQAQVAALQEQLKRLGHNGGPALDLAA